jgi:hypothetical protein
VTGHFPLHSPVRASARNLNGKALISFKDVPLDQVDTLTEALLNGIQSLRHAA